mmetsp:Transcript_56280/g.180694  ORF Transcript_56280/g.180694 Transcript_56280/m.180694 type:complete len:227 (-) Transcript_56280:475-1155(-)
MDWIVEPPRPMTLPGVPAGRSMVSTTLPMLSTVTSPGVALIVASGGLGASAASSTSCLARLIWSGLPAMRTRQVAGRVLSTSMRAPLAACSSMSRAPLTPRTAPLTAAGRSMYSDSWSAASMARVSTSFSACAICRSVPPMVILHGSTSLSTSTLAPVVVWISWTCAPRMPMTLPIFARGTSRTMPGLCLESSMISKILWRAAAMASGLPSSFTRHGSSVWSRAST